MRSVSASWAARRHQATVHQVTSASEAKVLKQPHEINLRMDNVITAVEAALLDLLGQHLGVPVCELLGAGKQRDAVRMLRLPLLYWRPAQNRSSLLQGLPETKNDWYRLRHEPAMDAAMRWFVWPKPRSNNMDSRTSS